MCQLNCGHTLLARSCLFKKLQFMWFLFLAIALKCGSSRHISYYFYFFSPSLIYIMLHAEDIHFNDFLVVFLHKFRVKQVVYGIGSVVADQSHVPVSPSDFEQISVSGQAPIVPSLLQMEIHSPQTNA
jgi:hypothetical protein